MIAASSFLDALGHRFLQAHMVQHVLLMTVAPPLLWMGAPVAPMLLRAADADPARGGPRPGHTGDRRLTGVLADPRVELGASLSLAFWTWHVPALYDLALRADLWHHVEHACFFASGLLFWRPVILPWPARSTWPRWAMYSVSRPRRDPERRAGGDPHVLGPGDLRGVRGRASDGRSLRARRSVDGRRDHVGARLHPLPPAGALADRDHAHGTEDHPDRPRRRGVGARGDHPASSASRSAAMSRPRSAITRRPVLARAAAGQPK